MGITEWTRGQYNFSLLNDISIKLQFLLQNHMDNNFLVRLRCGFKGNAQTDHWAHNSFILNGNILLEFIYL